MEIVKCFFWHWYGVIFEVGICACNGFREHWYSASGTIQWSFVNKPTSNVFQVHLWQCPPRLLNRFKHCMLWNRSDIIPRIWKYSIMDESDADINCSWILLHWDAGAVIKWWPNGGATLVQRYTSGISPANTRRWSNIGFNVCPASTTLAQH